VVGMERNALFRFLRSAFQRTVVVAHKQILYREAAAGCIPELSKQIVKIAVDAIERIFRIEL
jgi:hypothetical protein